MQIAIISNQRSKVYRRCYRFVTTVIILLVLLVRVTPAYAQSPTSVALVIGNGAYRDGIPTLPNPPNDATAFAGVVQRLGFATLLAIDANRNEMLVALQSFANAARGADVAIVYFSGHGVEVSGRNLLLPVDFTLKGGETQSAIEARAISLADVDAALTGTATTVVLLIDACRNDPFADTITGPVVTRGIASIPGTGSGLAPQTARSASAVIYATGPGSIAFDGAGAYSPFTTALIQSLETAGRNLTELVASVRSAVADATSGVQVPTPDRASISTVSLVKKTPKEILQQLAIARFATLARPIPGGGMATSMANNGFSWSFQGLPLVVQPAPPPFPFYCHAHAKRGWTRFPGGHGTIAVSRNSLACAIQIYGYPDARIPAVNLVVSEQPQAGRVIIRDNSFAYVPNPGFVGTDRFRIDADAVGGGPPLKMVGVIDVTVR